MKIADGSWNWFRIRDKIFKRKPDGSVSQIIGIAQDIHQQKTADERLSKAHGFLVSGIRNCEVSLKPFPFPKSGIFKCYSH